MKNLLILILFSAIAGCGNSHHSDGIIVLSSEAVRPIKVMLNDSLYYQINFDTSGSISSVLPYRAGILEGNAYELCGNKFSSKES